jgi:hypothetical protein
VRNGSDERRHHTPTTLKAQRQGTTSGARASATAANGIQKNIHAQGIHAPDL